MNFTTKTIKHKVIITIMSLILLTNISYSALEPGWFYFGMGTSLPNDLVSSIAVAADGKVWIGNLPYQWTGGISVFDGANWTYYEKDDNGLPSNSIQYLSADHSGKIYACFNDTTPHYIEEDIWMPMDFNGLDAEIKILNPIIFDQNNRMWASFSYFKFGYKGKGIGYYDTKWHIIDTSNSEIPENYVRCMTFDRHGDLWIASDSTIAKIITLKKWEVHNESKGMTAKYITSITTDRKNNIWASSMTGLYKYDGKEWTNYTTDNSDLSENRLYSVKIDRADNLWIATEDSCIVKYDGKDFIKYFIKDNWKVLANKLLKGIEIDSAGNLWAISSDMGCYMYNIANTSVQENASSKAIIQPNPASDYIEIKDISEDISINPSSNISIYNSMGRCVINSKRKSSSKRIDVSFLSPGLYFIRCGNSTYKFVKQ